MWMSSAFSRLALTVQSMLRTSSLVPAVWPKYYRYLLYISLRFCFGRVALDISMRAVSAVRRAKHHYCREYVCDEADYWHRCYHEMEAAYYAVKSALDAERQRCTPCVVLPSSPRLSPRQEVSESREEIVRTVQESHKQQVESYKVEVETTLKKLETALKTGRDFSIPS